MKVILRGKKWRTGLVDSAQLKTTKDIRVFVPGGNLFARFEVVIPLSQFHINYQEIIKEVSSTSKSLRWKPIGVFTLKDEKEWMLYLGGRRSDLYFIIRGLSSWDLIYNQLEDWLLTNPLAE